MTAAQTTTHQSDQHVAQLETLMRELIDCYQRMSVLAGLRHDAIKAASPSRLAGCIGEENLLVQRVAELEKQRVRIVSALAARFQSPDKAATRISWIADRLPGPTGERLRRMATELRELITALVKKNDAIKAAAEMLSSHVDALIKSVAASLNHAKTYGRRGVVAQGARVTTALDMTT